VSRFGYFSERRAAKEFESLDPRFREIVFYSEGAGDWPHLGPVVECLLRDHERDIAYLSSDPSDPGLAVDHPRLRSFMVGAGTARTVLFARIDCANFVMTLPDIDQLWLKRSSHPVHYVYLFHSMNSTHASYRKGSFDGYDTILCVGPHHVEEIRRTEQRYGLPEKSLVEHGSVKLDTMLAEVAGRSTNRSGPAQVLVAPSWGDCSLIEAPVGLELLDVLSGAGYKTVLRLHPMTVRRCPQLVAELDRRCAEDPLADLETDMNAIDSWLRADLMISDWSGAAIEYGFSLLRPVVYIDTPQKQVNPDWREIGMTPFEDEIRRELGSVVDPSEIHTVPAVIEALLDDPDAIRERASEARAKWVFNVGRSAAVAAGYLASLPGRQRTGADAAHARSSS
jgi:YidC/Oxa1 family membrane protein insertase